MIHHRSFWTEAWRTGGISLHDESHGIMSEVTKEGMTGEKTVKEGSAKGSPGKGKSARDNPARGNSVKGNPEKGNPEKGNPVKGNPEKRTPVKGNPEKENLAKEKFAKEKSAKEKFAREKAGKEVPEDDFAEARTDMRILLEQMSQKGVKLFVDGQAALPGEIAAKAVCEGSIYMADYVMGEAGIIEQVRFDRVTRR